MYAQRPAEIPSTALTTMKGQRIRREKVLVVDDEPAVSELLQEWLEKAGYRTVVAPDGIAGLRDFFNQRPDLVIVDIVLPNLNGWEVCRRIREVSAVPIIILSIKGNETDKVRGLNLGADDYLCKPFGSQELLARVASALRRAKMPAVSDENTEYSDGVLAVDFRRHEVYVRGQPVDVSPLEYRMLSCLLEHAGQVLTHEQLLDRVWGPEYDSTENVKLYVSYLRRKIEMDPSSPELIQTVRGVGYRYRRPPMAEQLA